MPRKAKTQKGTPFTLEMAETFFSAIKEDLDSLREEIDLRFKGVDELFKNIAQMFQDNNNDKKEMKLDAWNHERRIQKLEKQTV